MRRHAIPATVTSGGRVATSFTPGPADALTGSQRWREVYARFRQHMTPGDAAKCTAKAWRHGCVLSGAPVLFHLGYEDVALSQEDEQR